MDKTAAKTSNGAALAKNALYIASYIDPAKFKPSFSMQGVKAQATKARSYADAYKELQTLEGGMQAKVFDLGWSNRRGKCLQDLSMLK